VKGLREGLVGYAGAVAGRPDGWHGLICDIFPRRLSHFSRSEARFPDSRSSDSFLIHTTTSAAARLG
jgi:hypothetical protein